MFTRRVLRWTLIQINHIRYQTLTLPLSHLAVPGSLLISVIKPTLDRSANKTPGDGRLCRPCNSKPKSRNERPPYRNVLSRRDSIVLICSPLPAKSSKMSGIGHKACYYRQKGAACVNTPQKTAMDRFVTRENIERYRKLASKSIDAAERSRIMKLLADEVTKIKFELRRRSNAPERRSPVGAATENRAEHDGEEQRGGG